jgi:hypothetical protein
MGPTNYQGKNIKLFRKQNSLISPLIPIAWKYRERDEEEFFFIFCCCC